MKNTAIILSVVIFSLMLVSCHAAPSAEDMLTDFMSAYSAEGIVYSSVAREGDVGYLDRDTLTEIYQDREIPNENYAVFLNSRPDYGSECGVFVCKDTEEVRRVTDTLERRLKLLRGEERSLLIRSGNIVFYSTMRDRDTAEKIWRDIIRAHL